MNNYKKKLVINIVVLIIICIYFYLLNYMFSSMEKEKFANIYKYISIGIIFTTITIFEIAYKKESGTIAIYGIETLIISICTLISLHMVSKFNISFQKYIIISSIIFLIYYIFKCILLFTKDRKTYLKSLSDIQEIVTSEPLKKEAKRKK